MRTKELLQIEVVSEKDPQSFQDKVNAALMRHSDPELIFDKHTPFTAIIVYKIHKAGPETMLELYELLNEQGPATCGQCPYFQRNFDGRAKWHTCTFSKNKTRENSRACEEYYKHKREELNPLAMEYEHIPYKID